MGFLLFSLFQVKDNHMLVLPEGLFQNELNVRESRETWLQAKVNIIF